MSDLKRCPCGAIPEVLCIQGGDSAKYAYVCGSCCGEWSTEFRTGYYELDTHECYQLAKTAWNGAPRGA